MSTVKLIIDDQEVVVEKGTPLIEACEKAGAQIPRFCYHKKLEVAGNCRMCLVDVVGARKPTASCATPVAEGMVVHTNTQKVKEDREAVLEFLLANHPLDCPICDQGGECDLQDITMAFGRDHSRFAFEKRAVADKDLGPLIKTIMTRCIHCTRCIRFTEEVAGEAEIGATGRGEDMEITNYLHALVSNELSGNVVDLCPVGALTAKPSALKARPWELKHTDSIDIMDAMGSHLRVDSRGEEVLRVLPRACEEINEEWITDKARFAYDGLKYQRLDQPYRRKKGKLVPATWDECFNIIKQKLTNTNISKTAAFVGPLTDMESALAAAKIFKHLAYEEPMYGVTQLGEKALFMQTPVPAIEQAKCLLLVGTNPRWEAPLLNTRILKAVRQGAEVLHVGEPVALNSPVQQVGKHANDLVSLLQNTQPDHVLVGGHVLSQPHGYTLYQWLEQQLPAASINMLHHQVGALSAGLAAIALSTQPVDMQACAFAYLLGADRMAAQLPDSTFVVYQGHHGDAGAKRADVILPAAAYTEMQATYANIEGRFQQTQAAVPPPGKARPSFDILKELGWLLENDVSQVMDALSNRRHTIPLADPIKSEELNDITLTSAIHNYYNTNIITHYSPTMQKCTQALLKQKEKADV